MESASGEYHGEYHCEDGQRLMNTTMPLGEETITISMTIEGEMLTMSEMVEEETTE